MFPQDLLPDLHPRSLPRSSRPPRPPLPHRPSAQFQTGDAPVFLEYLGYLEYSEYF